MPWVHSQSFQPEVCQYANECGGVAELPTFCIDDSTIVKLEQETTGCVFDVYEIMNQQLDVTMDIGSFVAMKPQRSRHGESLFFSLFTDPLQPNAMQ